MARTHTYIARLFKSGYSVQGLVRKLNMPFWRIEHAIRAVLERRGRR